MTNWEPTLTTQQDVTVESPTQKMEELQTTRNSLQHHQAGDASLPEINPQHGEGQPQIVTIEEEEWNIRPEETESQDVMDDFDSTTLDEVTISAIYEGLLDALIEGHPEEKEDFSLGQ